MFFSSQFDKIQYLSQFFELIRNVDSLRTGFFAFPAFNAFAEQSRFPKGEFRLVPRHFRIREHPIIVVYPEISRNFNPDGAGQAILAVCAFDRFELFQFFLNLRNDRPFFLVQRLEILERVNVVNDLVQLVHPAQNDLHSGKAPDPPQSPGGG